METQKEVKRRFLTVHQTLADVAEFLSKNYVAAIREYSHKQAGTLGMGESSADISYGYAMGYWSALDQLEGLRESQYTKRASEIEQARHREGKP